MKRRLVNKQNIWENNKKNRKMPQTFETDYN